MQPRTPEEISDQEIVDYMDSCQDAFMADLGRTDENKDEFSVQSVETIYKSEFHDPIATEYIYRSGRHVGTMIIGITDHPGLYPKKVELKVECNRVPDFLQ